MSRDARLTVIPLVLLGVVMAGCGGGGGDSASTTTSSTHADRFDPGSTAGLSPATRRELDRLDRRLQPPRTPAQEVRGVVAVVLKLGGSATCSPPLVTPRYVEAAYGTREGCVNATQGHAGVADELQFRSVRITEPTAKVVVIPSGGIYDGQRITVSLVHDPRWAVDALRSNVPVGP